MSFLRRRADYILLPFVSFVATRVLFPGGGLYSDYNEIHFVPILYLRTFYLSLANAVYGRLDNALQAIIDHPALSLLVLLVMATL